MGLTFDARGEATQPRRGIDVHAANNDVEFARRRTKPPRDLQQIDCV